MTTATVATTSTAAVAYWLARRCTAPAAPRGRGRHGLAPALVQEAPDLAGEALRLQAQLEDRARLDHAAVPQLAYEHVGVGERVDRGAWMPDPERTRLDLAALGAGRGRAAEEETLEVGAGRLRVLAGPVESDVQKLP